jgi:hypothetical protein
MAKTYQPALTQFAGGGRNDIFSARPGIPRIGLVGEEN